MARYEIIKTIEAKKLNPRSGLPLTEPPVTIPYSAILDKLEESWDLVKFSYLGNKYQCATSTFQEAARPYGSPDEAAPAAAAAEAPAEAAIPAQPPAPVRMKWEKLSSNHSTVARAKLPGGWLVSVGTSVLFYSDPEHGWDGSTLE